MIKLCLIMSRLKSGIWPILGLKLAILATFLKISTSNLFYPAFTIRLIGKPNKKPNFWPKWVQNFLGA